MLRGMANQVFPYLSYKDMEQWLSSHLLVQHGHVGTEQKYLPVFGEVQIWIFLAGGHHYLVKVMWNDNTFQINRDSFSFLTSVQQTKGWTRILIHHGYFSLCFSENQGAFHVLPTQAVKHICHSPLLFAQSDACAVWVPSHCSHGIWFSL